MKNTVKRVAEKLINKHFAFNNVALDYVETGYAEYYVGTFEGKNIEIQVFSEDVDSLCYDFFDKLAIAGQREYTFYYRYEGNEDWNYLDSYTA